MRGYAKKIYDCLQDEVSRQIFINRLAFSETGNPIYIKHIVDAYTPFSGESSEVRCQRLRDKMELLPSNRKIIIYGVGACGKEVFSILKKRKGIIFCDRNKELLGNEFQGIPVITPEELSVKYADAFIIIASIKYEKEIHDYLLAQQFQESEIMTVADYVSLTQLDEQYFDKDIISFSDSEIFVDCGCYDFFTSRLLLKKCKSVKKIYAFEPNKQQYAVCKHIINSLIPEVGGGGANV